MAESNIVVEDAIEYFNSLGEQTRGSDDADRIELSEAGFGLPRVVEDDCVRISHSEGEAAGSAAGNEDSGAIAAACTRKEGSNLSEDIGAMQVHEPKTANTRGKLTTASEEAQFRGFDNATK
mmetsp:Transcript_17181/g.34957  ORF Transcript_17181/g.34957 Transcript_17181/m.34957 type:complete len:122 (-) Transcript_17181:181-546(-)